ncbi:MAG: glutathione peroxidase [Vicinamibacterales bacterium]
MSLRHTLGGLAAGATGLLSALGRRAGTTEVHPMSASLYSLTVPALDGTPVDLSAYDGQVTLVVNVASACGFTPQYAGLQALHDALSPQGFAVLGFPSNDFGRQEPGSAEEIRTFCETSYGVRFPMFAKVETRPGPGQSPVYRLLGETGHLPAWNFAKYLVGRDGQVRAFFPSGVAPESREMREALKSCDLVIS